MHGFRLWSLCPYLECFAGSRYVINSVLSQLLWWLFVFLFTSRVFLPLLDVSHLNRPSSTGHILIELAEFLIIIVAFQNEKSEIHGKDSKKAPIKINQVLLKLK